MLRTQDTNNRDGTEIQEQPMETRSTEGRDNSEPSEIERRTKTNWTTKLGLIGIMVLLVTILESAACYTIKYADCT